MYIDSQNQYAAAQALTVTAVSTNAIDHTKDRNLGIGNPLVVVITIGVAAAGTAPTLQVTLQADTTSAFGSPVSVASTAVLTAAQMVAGAQFVLPVPPDLTMDRWSRLNFTMGGTTPTVTVTAELQPANAVQNVVYYPAGTTIS